MVEAEDDLRERPWIFECLKSGVLGSDVSGVLGSDLSVFSVGGSGSSDSLSS